MVIYTDNAEKPSSTEVYSDNFLINWNPAFLGGWSLINLQTNPQTAPVLTAGKYWVSIYGVYDTITSTNSGRWDWHTGTTAIGSDLHIQDKSGIFGGIPWTSASAIQQNPSAYFWLTGDETPATGINTSTVIDEGVNVYPNPAKDQITFSTSNTAVTNVNIYDVTGSLIETISMNSLSVVLNLEKYNSGLYFYKSISNNNELVGTGKFIVK